MKAYSNVSLQTRYRRPAVCTRIVLWINLGSPSSRGAPTVREDGTDPDDDVINRIDISSIPNTR